MAPSTYSDIEHPNVLSYVLVFPSLRERSTRSLVNEVANDRALGSGVGWFPSHDNVVSVGVMALQVHGCSGSPCDQGVSICHGKTCVHIIYKVGSLPSLPTDLQTHILSQQFDLYHQIISICLISQQNDIKKYKCL